MKTLTKKQQLLLLLALIVFSLIWYFGFYKKKVFNTSEESGYDSSWINIGDDFFIPNNSNVELVKKYIDGTISNGIKIDSDGNCLCGGQKNIPHGIPNSPGYWVEHTREKISYPKDKGFTKSDSRGNYFYFEPLSDLQMAEINRLTELKRQADEAARIAAQAEADRIAAQQAADAQAAQQANATAAQQAAAAAQQAAAAKAIAEHKIAAAKAAQAKADAEIAAARQKSEEIKSENLSKNRKMIIVIVLILIISISGYFWYKKRKNS